jgi:pilus assembly protein CpaC
MRLQGYTLKTVVLCLLPAFFAICASAQQAIAQGTAAQASGAAAESPNDLFVNVGKSVIVDSSLPIERVSIGFGDVAEATAVGPQEVLVNGKAPGETSLIIWQQGGTKLFFDVRVQPSQFASDSRLDMLRRQLGKELPGQKVDPSIEGDAVFLRGTAKDMTSALRAMTIAGSFGKPVDLLYVEAPKPETQILLKVKFASVDRSRSTQLGINLFSTGATNTIGSVTTQQFSPPIVGSATSTGGSGSTTGAAVGKLGQATLSNALNLFFFRPDLNLGATIEALEARNIVQVLAEPNLLAENGKEASFLAGGEFPYPVVQGSSAGGTNAITIQFRQFGVRLNFIPTLMPAGTIRLQVAPEVSSLDYANGITVSGFTVPGISVRNVTTEVELSEGQSFAIGGLLDNRETELFNKVPFIGDIPILGKLFQSRTLTKNNTELMVIVTPQIIRPIPAGQPVPALNYPVKFLPPNTDHDMATPGQNVTGPVPVTPPNATIPIESLVKSLQPETPLNVRSTSSSMSNGSGQQTTATPLAPTTAPQQ